MTDSDSQAQFSGTKPIEEKHRFEQARLVEFLRDKVDGFD